MAVEGHISGRRLCARTILIKGLLSFLAACDGAEASDSEGSESPVVIELTDDHNFSSASTLTIPSIETAAGVDLDICWGDVDTDLLCHEMNPSETIKGVSLARLINLSKEEAAERIAAGTLSSAHLSGYLSNSLEAGGTCVKLTEFSLFGTEVDVLDEYVESEDHTYLLLFTDRTKPPGAGARTMAFIDPRGVSTNTRVDAPSGCGEEPLLDFDADLSSLTPLDLPVKGPWPIDWRNITVDSLGNPVPFLDIDSVMVAFYEGLSVEELEAQFLDIQIIATNLWELKLEMGRSASLSEARERTSGEAFSGFAAGGDGTWLLGLMCSTCQNPAPVFLTVVTPTGGRP